MKFLRKAGLGLLATLVASLLAAGAWAQTSTSTQDGTSTQQGEHRRFEGRHRGHGADVFSQLNLTEDQKTRMHALMQTGQQQAQAIRQDTTLTEEQKREKMQQIHKDMQAQFQSVLTPDQQKQFSAMREAGPRMHGGAGPRGEMGGRFAGLNLTDAQKSQLKPIFESAHQKMATLRNDATLTADQKREQMKQIHAQMHSQLSAILTPEQQQQLEQHHRHGGHPGAAKPQS